MNTLNTPNVVYILITYIKSRFISYIYILYIFTFLYKNTSKHTISRKNFVIVPFCELNTTSDLLMLLLFPELSLALCLNFSRSQYRYSECVHYDAINDVDHVGYQCITFITLIYVIVLTSIVNVKIRTIQFTLGKEQRKSCNQTRTWIQKRLLAFIEKEI